MQNAPWWSRADFEVAGRTDAWRDLILGSPPDIRLDGTVPYGQGSILYVPADSGVYLLHDMRGCLYIGRTGNLNARYHQHFWKSHNPRLVTALCNPVGQMRFSWLVESADRTGEVERNLIRAMQPLCNTIRYRSAK